MGLDNDIHVCDLVDMNDPFCVMAEVRGIIARMFPDFDCETLDKVFDDILRLFAGQYPGYLKCNTHYHNLRHTTDAFMAMIRLIHGAILGGWHINQKNVMLAMVTTLMHDTGYIQKTTESSGTGGQYTLVHIERSILFLQSYFLKNRLFVSSIKDCSDILRCTGFDTSVDKIRFKTPQIELMGRLLGTADLIGQIGDITYIKKLPHLYQEFIEANIEGYETEMDIFDKTFAFYQITRKRIDNDLGNMPRFLPNHFKSRFRIDQDLYYLAMEKNISQLNHMLENGHESFKKAYKTRYGRTIH
ncbi:hypothetical protein QUF76_01695 [Desulfobacterales bacterium HSG16]|nr:hypothetical protein [Desulfobacterales bacterium HSG16]